LKIVSMLRLFQAGVIAALMQGVAILLATLLVFSYAHHRIENLQMPTDDPTVLSLVPLLQLIYLLTAVGATATRHRFVDLTAERIRRASRLKDGGGPRLTAANPMAANHSEIIKVFAARSGSAGFILTEHGWHLAYFDAAPIIWSGMMSIGVASFGANAQAAALTQ
jgi:hypothetical protein